MTTPASPPAVERYLARFDEDAKVLPKARRVVLRAELSSHLAEILPVNASADQIAAVLDQLGAPIEIVSQELEAGQSHAGPRPGGLSRLIYLVLAVVAALFLGAIAAPFVAGLFAPVEDWAPIAGGALAVTGMIVLVLARRQGRR